MSANSPSPSGTNRPPANDEQREHRAEDLHDVLARQQVAHEQAERGEHQRAHPREPPARRASALVVPVAPLARPTTATTTTATSPRTIATATLVET